LLFIKLGKEQEAAEIFPVFLQKILKNSRFINNTIGALAAFAIKHLLPYLRKKV
jgi:hypothetical protein